MSIKKIRDALEGQLATLVGTVPVAWENKQFSPKIGTAYLRVNLLPAQTQNPSFGGVHNRETGILQVMVTFPSGNGSAAAAAWVETIRDGFARGSSFTSSGVTVRILRQPSVGAALQTGDWFAIPVSITYQADILA